MVTIVSAVVGAFWGGYVAKKRGGNRLDIAQYAAGFGIACGIVGAIVSTVLARMLF